jgi:hypothetical protein
MNCELFIKIRHPNFIENELWTFIKLHPFCIEVDDSEFIQFSSTSRSGSMGFVNERGATVDDATGSRRCTRTGKPVDILKSIVFAGVVVAAALLRNCAFSDDQI